MKLIDLTGEMFGDLTVLHRGENKEKATYWVCQCKCGNVKSFSVNKYGDELAEFLAITVREKRLWELNKLGAGYTEHHGK